MTITSIAIADSRRQIPARFIALGSFATVYLPADAAIAALTRRLAAVPGVEVVLDRAGACARFGLPPDRVGDLVVISTRNVVLGTAAARHDLSGAARHSSHMMTAM